MATQVQNRRGSTAEHSTFTGAVGEVTVDTDKEVVVVHDGTTAGGYPQMRENGSNSALALGSAATPSLKFTGDTNTGIYSPGADQVAISTNGTGRFFIDSNGNLGVGISSIPNYNANLRTVSFNNTNGVVHDYAVGGTRTGSLVCQSGSFEISTQTNIPLVFSTNSTERMRLTSTGLGIGTTSPGELLSLNSSPSNAAISIRTGGASFNSVVKFNADDTNYAGIGLENTALVMRCSNSSTPTERARIDSSGRLLVGTSSGRANFFNSSYSPQFQVETTDNLTRAMSVVSSTAGPEGGILILGNQRSGSAGGNTAVVATDELGQISFQGSDGTEFVSGAVISGLVDGTPGANSMPGRIVLSTTAAGASSPTERMRIDSAGALKTSTNGSYKFPAGVTEITHNDTNSSIQLIASNTSFAGDAVTISAYRNTTNATYNFLSCVRQGFAFALSIRDSGNVVNVNNSYGAFSDLKLKENIVDATSQWSDIKALQVRKYNFKEGQTHTQIGLVAQEVELVSPGLVSESPDRDAEGNDLGTVTKSVNYSVLYMKAVKALQEAMERIETLEAKVAALETP